jgi:hypothetical protein
MYRACCSLYAMVTRAVVSRELTVQDFRVENSEADGPNLHVMQRRKMKTGRGGPAKKKGGKNEACTFALAL